MITLSGHLRNIEGEEGWGWLHLDDNLLAPMIEKQLIDKAPPVPPLYDATTGESNFDRVFADYGKVRIAIEQVEDATTGGAE